MGHRRDEGLDVEVEWPAQDDAGEPAAPHGGRVQRFVLVAGAVAFVGIAAVVLARPADQPVGGPTLTTASVPARVPEPQATGRLVAALGDKVVSRRVEGTTTDLVTVLRLAGGPHSLFTVGTGVVAVGRDPAGRPTQAWVLSPGSTDARSLGAVDAAVPSVRHGLVWLVGDGTAREVDLSGNVNAGPFTVEGTVVGMAGAGLVLDRGGRVVWWPPDRAVAKDIGLGTVLDTRFEEILWVAANGLLTLTDPNTLDSQVLLVDRAADEVVVAGAIAPTGGRVAVMTERGVHFVGPGQDASVFVAVDRPAVMAWASDTALLAADRAGALRLLTVQGEVRKLPGLPVGPAALAFVPREP